MCVLLDQLKLQRAALLDAVILQCISILELSSGKEQPLLIRRNAFLVLYLGPYVLDAVGSTSSIICLPLGVTTDICIASASPARSAHASAATVNAMSLRFEVIASFPHPFSPPRATPRTMDLRANRNSTIIGSTTTVDAAMSSSGLEPASVVNT